MKILAKKIVFTTDFEQVFTVMKWNKQFIINQNAKKVYLLLSHVPWESFI